jgi:hypothetical protein
MKFYIRVIKGARYSIWGSPRAGDAIHPVLLGRVWLVRLSSCSQLFLPLSEELQVVLHPRTLTL